MYKLILLCILFIIYNSFVQGEPFTTTALTEYTIKSTSTTAPTTTTTTTTAITTTTTTTTTITTSTITTPATFTNKPTSTITSDISLLNTDISLTAATKENNCVSLRRSKVCTAFSQFYIGLPGLEYDYPFLINTTTIEEFDQRLLDYADSTSDYLFPLGCLSSNYNPTVPYARYSLTRLCAGMIQNPTYSLPCNYENALSPPPLCKTTCVQWVNSIESITASHRVCSDTSQRNNTLNSFQDQCETWAGYNGTIAENCISGVANEPYSCGFGNETKRACRHCKRHPDDTCCQMVDYCGLSSGAIVGIVFGSLAGASFIVFGILWFYFKKRHRILKSLHLFTESSSSSTTNATAVNTVHHIPFTTTTSSSTITGIPATTETPTTATKPGNVPFINDKLEIIDTKNNQLSQTTDNDSNKSMDETTSNPLNEEFFVVVHSYPPRMPDELQLNMGDIICIAFHFDDGWALGYNVTTGEKGAFPLVCISPAPEQSLDQLLHMEDAYSISSGRSSSGSSCHRTNSHPVAHSTTTTAVDTSRNPSFTTENTNNSNSLQLTMERIRESVRRSLSLNPHELQQNTNDDHLNYTNTFPKRSFSYKPTTTTTSTTTTTMTTIAASHYDYFEAESPSSPTTNTPFFNHFADNNNNNILQSTNNTNTLHPLSSSSSSSSSASQQQRIAMRRNNTLG